MPSAEDRFPTTNTASSGLRRVESLARLYRPRPPVAPLRNPNDTPLTDYYFTSDGVAVTGIQRVVDTLCHFYQFDAGVRVDYYFPRIIHPAAEATMGTLWLRGCCAAHSGFSYANEMTSIGSVVTSETQLLRGDVFNQVDRTNLTMQDAFIFSTYLDDRHMRLFRLRADVSPERLFDLMSPSFQDMMIATGSRDCVACVSSLCMTIEPAGGHSAETIMDTLDRPTYAYFGVDDVRSTPFLCIQFEPARATEGMHGGHVSILGMRLIPVVPAILRERPLLPLAESIVDSALRDANSILSIEQSITWAQVCDARFASDTPLPLFSDDAHVNDHWTRDIVRTGFRMLTDSDRLAYQRSGMRTFRQRQLNYAHIDTERRRIV